MKIVKLILSIVGILGITFIGFLIFADLSCTKVSDAWAPGCGLFLFIAILFLAPVLILVSFNVIGDFFKKRNKKSEDIKLK